MFLTLECVKSHSKNSLLPMGRNAEIFILICDVQCTLTHAQYPIYLNIKVYIVSAYYIYTKHPNKHSYTYPPSTFYHLNIQTACLWVYIHVLCLSFWAIFFKAVCCYYYKSISSILFICYNSSIIQQSWGWKA